MQGACIGWQFLEKSRSCWRKPGTSVGQDALKNCLLSEPYLLVSGLDQVGEGVIGRTMIGRPRVSRYKFQIELARIVIIDTAKEEMNTE